MINIFKIEKDDNNQKQPLLNLIIRIIGLFIKQFFFFPKEIEISIFGKFLRFVPNVLNNKERPSYLYVNLIKVLGLMITFANIHIQKSLSFYKSFIDFNILFSLVKVLKNNGNQNYIITKSCLECLTILFHPKIGDIHFFQLLTNEELEKKFKGYDEVKSSFLYIDLLKKNFFILLKKKIFWKYYLNYMI